MGLGLGLGLSAVLLSQLGSLPAVQPLRTVAVDNRINNASDTQARPNQIVRYAYMIGSGDVSEIVFSASTKIFVSGAAPAVNGYTITAMALERNGTSQVVPITFGGSRSKVLAAGDDDVQSDPLPASAFGLTKFTRGEIYWLRAIITLASTSHSIPFTGNQANQRAGQSVIWYDPANYTITNGVDSTGAITGTGTGQSSRSSGFHPIMLGRFVSGDPKTFFGLGDSIHFGQGDNIATAPNGYGIFARALIDADGVSNPYASLNFNRVGTSTNDVQNNSPYIKNYFKYAGILVDGYGANDLGTAGAGNVATIKSNLQAIWAQFKAANPFGFIVRTYIYPRSTSTDSWATLGNQTVVTGYPTQAPDLNSFFDSKLADGTLNAVLGYSPTVSAVGSGEPLKWAVNGSALYATTDGAHPSSASHISRAGELRTVLATVGNSGSMV